MLHRIQRQLLDRTLLIVSITIEDVPDGLIAGSLRWLVRLRAFDAADKSSKKKQDSLCAGMASTVQVQDKG